MAIDFPASPTLNQSFTSAGVVYTWNGYAWSGGGPASAPFPHGQCRLVYGSTTDLWLVPYNGNLLFIGNAVRAIPSPGVKLVVTGLLATTKYYIYAFMNGQQLTLEASTTGHSQDTITGVEIKTGDPTRTLVGMAQTLIGPIWGDTSTYRLVRSWFNDPGTFQMNTLAATLNNISRGPNPQELDTAMRAYILPWQGEMVVAQVQLVAAATVQMTINVAGAVNVENNVLYPYAGVFIPTDVAGGGVPISVATRFNTLTAETMAILIVSVWHPGATASYYKDLSQLQVHCQGRR